MAKPVSKNLKTINVWWVRLVFAALFLAIAYAFASLAINSGNLVEYAVAIVFLVWAFKDAIRGLRLLFKRSDLVKR